MSCPVNLSFIGTSIFNADAAESNKATLSVNRLHAPPPLVYKNRKFLGGGWPKFTFDNGLRNGDICVFELKEKNNEMVTMMVHIIYGNGQSCSGVTSPYGRT